MPNPEISNYILAETKTNKPSINNVFEFCNNRSSLGTRLWCALHQGHTGDCEFERSEELKYCNNVSNYLKCERPANHSGVCYFTIKLNVQRETKTNRSKLRLDLLPIRALEEIAKAFQYGVDEKNYPPWDWLTIKDWQDLYFGATLRHLFDWRKGVTKDADSGLHPLAHAGANILIMLTRDKGHGK